jgi:hypothetical protein
MASPVERAATSDCGFVDIFYEPIIGCQVATALTLNAVLGNSAALKVPSSGEGKSACVNTIGYTAESFELTVNGQVPSDCVLHYFAQSQCVGDFKTNDITPTTCINEAARSFQLVC